MHVNQKENELRRLLAYLREESYTLARDVLVEKGLRKRLLMVLADPRVNLIEKHPETGSSDAAYRLTRAGKRVLEALNDLNLNDLNSL